MPTEPRGLPDFGTRLSPGGATVYAPYAMGTPPFVLGPYVLWPERLDVAVRDDGRPDFSLELLRGTDPTRPPEPHARLDYRLAAASRFDATLTALRELEPRTHATLTLARPRSGFLRITPLIGGADLPAELQVPVALAWDGLDSTRVWQRLSLDDGIVLRDALAAGTLLARADVQLEIEGVSPRLAARATFDPREVLAALHQRADGDGVIEREQVAAYFLDAADRLVTTQLRPRPEPAALAEILTDRVRVRFASPAMGAPGRAAMRLPALDSIGAGRFEWDLSRPVVVPRTAILSLDPFEGARQTAERDGIDAVVRTTVIPAFDRGALAVTVDVNLPPRPEGLLGLGVNLDAPPAPPRRIQTARATVELSADQPTATAVLKLATGEEPTYFYEVYAVVRGRGAIDRLLGERTAHRGGALYLAPSALPVRFVPVSADAALLEQGDLEVCLMWAIGDQRFEHRATATPAAPAMSLVLPGQVDSAAVDVTLVERGGSRRAGAPRVPATGVSVGLHSFASYGPRHLEVCALFRDGDPPILIDVRPEASDADASHPDPGPDPDPDHDPATVTALLTPENPRRTVTYLSSSILRSGYLWRWRAAGGGEYTSRWSGVTQDSVLLVNPHREDAVTTDTVTLSEIVAERDRSAPARFIYWPSRPRPELGPNGQPTLMLIAGSERGLLQLGLRWAVSEDEVAKLRRQVLDSDDRLEDATLELVPATFADVEASVAVRAADGTETELARRPASGSSPQSAIFNVSLDTAALARVREALTGERGRLLVRYHAKQTRPVKIEAVIAGDATEDVAALAGTPSPDDVRARLDAALAAGRLTLTAPDESLPEEARTKAVAAARDGAVALLTSMATGAEMTADPATLRVAVAAEEPLARATAVESDLGEWFGSGRTANVVELPAGVNP